VGLVALTLLAARWLARDLRSHPAGFPAPSVSHGLRFGDVHSATGWRASSTSTQTRSSPRS
jgi:hypothetical protein